jgi:hypothetical protein
VAAGRSERCEDARKIVRGGQAVADEEHAQRCRCRRRRHGKRPSVATPASGQVNVRTNRIFSELLTTVSGSEKQKAGVEPACLRTGLPRLEFVGY